jgi:branched-chain amino acid transport system ATP-binding protein
VDRLVALDFGRMITQGDPHAVMADPAVREIYMGIDLE